MKKNDVTIVKAMAKVNLCLKIPGKEGNLHKISSICCFVNVYDHIAYKEADKYSITTTGEFANDLVGDNLIDKAMDIIYSKKQYNLPPLKIKLEKNLPIGAGIGGGSSDVGFLLRSLSNCFGIELTQEELLSLGSDVPLCYYGSSALVGGIGNIITPIKLPKLYILLVNPRIHLSTQDMYSRIDSYSESISLSSIDFSFEEIIHLLKSQGNDFIKVIHEEKIISLLKYLEKLDGCIYSSMSGSGSTCFAIFKNNQDLAKSYLQIQQKFPYYWYEGCETIFTTHNFIR